MSGLQTSQQSLQTISNNIANVNTEGYSRKVVDQAARIIMNFCINKTDLLLLNVSEPTVLAQERFKMLFPEKNFDDFFRIDNPGKQLDISNLLKSKLLDG